jgi:AcrR family transcriptional regulator
VTVEAILEAAARILDRQGWERFTTNGVAETAGVSIGSLYQYFPNKLALVEAILQRHFDAVLSALRSADERTSRGERIEGLISGTIAADLGCGFCWCVEERAGRAFVLCADSPFVSEG